MHGEDLIGPRPFKGFLETPPHAWGRLPCAVCEARHVGNTPTCMGKTAISTSRKSAGWKHPHMHGEDDALLLASAIDMETPPHAWGRLIGISNIKTSLRNTPTCMGKTTGSRWLTPERRKHPHMHGEDPERNNTKWYIRETPPHAWGRRPYPIDKFINSRNTPTCMGKTYLGA